jgi:hypothetical protein
MKQYRVVGLGNYSDYYSFFFLYGLMEGTILNGHLFRAVPLFGQSLANVKAQIEWFKPHIIIGHMFFNRAPHPIEQVFSMLSYFKRKGVTIFYHAGDARPEPRYPSNISTIVSAVLINHWPVRYSYKVWKVPCYHWPYACLQQKELAEPVNIFKCDLAFTGSLDSNVHHAPRARFINEIRSKIPIKVFPTAESGNTRFQTAELSASAKGVLGFQMGLEMPGYQDVRPFQYIGAGAVYFHDKHPFIDNFFEDGMHYISFQRDNAEDFYNKFREYNNNSKIRKESLKYCQTYHSYKERMRGVFDIIEGKEYKLHYLKEVV